MSGFDFQRYTVLTAPTSTTISSGTFKQRNAYFTPKGSFQRLEDVTSPAAFHDSAHRLDPPKCHPNTRNKVFDYLFDWVRAGRDREKPVMWVNGAPGTGKSAIAQTLAELCDKEGIPVASFFFSHLDQTRNTTIPLVATLAYQLILKIPASKSIILNVIDQNPRIFQQSLATQFIDLIATPLLRLAPSDFLVVIDGLDECHGRDSHATIIRCIGNIVRRKAPLFFLIASRNEGEIATAFSSEATCDSVIRVALDGDYLPDDDIRIFFQEKLVEIKKTHPLARRIDHKWPTSELIDALVNKSSGQFVYAAVVVRYVSIAASDPVHCLETVCALGPSQVTTPYAELDALYHHIFASMKDFGSAHPILAYTVLMRHTDMDTINDVFDRNEVSIKALLSDLKSLLICKDGYIIYLHASLSDFLLDVRRSKEYHIDPSYWHSKFAIQWFKRCYSIASITPITDLTRHLQNSRPSPDLLNQLMMFQPLIKHFGPRPDAVHMIDYLSAILALDFRDKKIAYESQCARLTRLAYDTNRRDIIRIKEVHNISPTLLEIQREEEERMEAEEAKKRQRKRANNWQDRLTRASGTLYIKFVPNESFLFVVLSYLAKTRD